MDHDPLVSRRTLLASLVTATLLLVGGPAGATDQVTLAPDWVIGGTRTPYFVAADKGF
jgi:ABC-type nitrate/sulfonate/bicarbonate transport system substrate-binding protein